MFWNLRFHEVCKIQYVLNFAVVKLQNILKKNTSPTKYSADAFVFLSSRENIV